MKFLVLLILSSSLLSFAQTDRQRKELLRERMESEMGVVNLKEVGICRYELIGNGVRNKVVFEEEDMNFEKCEQAAKSALNLSKIFTSALVKHPSKENWIQVKKDK